MLWAEVETLVLDLPLKNKRGNKPFHPKERFAINFFDHTESIVNLPRAETHWQDNYIKTELEKYRQFYLEEVKIIESLTNQLK